jgi:hypothetical protein
VPDTGAAYVFSGDFSGSPAKLLSSDHATSDVFGLAVSVSGSTVAIGAISASGGLDSSAPLQAGAAYVFTASGTGWTEQQKLFKPDAAPLESFGNYVSLDGDSLFVSCPHITDLTGSAFVFVRSENAWSDGVPLAAPTDLEIGDAFGQSIAFFRTNGDRRHRKLSGRRQGNCFRSCHELTMLSRKRLRPGQLHGRRLLYYGLQWHVCELPSRSQDVGHRRRNLRTGARGD